MGWRRWRWRRGTGGILQRSPTISTPSSRGSSPCGICSAHPGWDAYRPSWYLLGEPDFLGVYHFFSLMLLRSWGWRKGVHKARYRHFDSSGLRARGSPPSKWKCHMEKTFCTDVIYNASCVNLHIDGVWTLIDSLATVLNIDVFQGQLIPLCAGFYQFGVNRSRSLSKVDLRK